MRRALVWLVGVAALLSTGLALAIVATDGDPAAAAVESMDAPGGTIRWGADYFPNVPLTTHEGRQVRFFDDLIEGKVVVVNFIYTSCPDTCPLETARLKKLQDILGDRVGRDVFMYSITIDPDRDTVDVLDAYAERFQAGPGWWFLTGEDADITLLRKKLGLYIDEIQDGSNDHNLNLIIGNQSTGQWMKRSPFENPYYLATQVGGWLHNWTVPEAEPTDYANAPRLRQPSMGETLYRTRCSPCHSIGGGDVLSTNGLLGPDLLGVTDRRERAWLTRWLMEPERMLAERDPIIMPLYAQFNQVAMPNMRLSEYETNGLIEYLAAESRRVMVAGDQQRREGTVPAPKSPAEPSTGSRTLDLTASETTRDGTAPTGFDLVVTSYLEIQRALAGDTIDGVPRSAITAAAGARELGLAGTSMVTAARSVRDADSLAVARRAFGALSDALLDYARETGQPLGEGVEVAYCPMVRKSWAQQGTVITNPYHGASMLSCGVITSDWQASEED